LRRGRIGDGDFQCSITCDATAQDTRVLAVGLPIPDSGSQRSTDWGFGRIHCPMASCGFQCG
jgi:hypothetical protein